MVSLTAAGAAASIVLATAGCGRPIATAGFWYDAGSSFTLPAHAAETLGGDLSRAELESIEAVSRAELDRAFAGMRLRITDNHHAFWSVAVFRSLRGRGPFPDAGESISFGWLGGTGAVSFDLVTQRAVQYAPRGAPRQRILEAIGRGIGRVAAHELGHQILNAGLAHNGDDEDSYEYPSPDRPSQYYGELHWSTALPLLARKLR